MGRQIQFSPKLLTLEAVAEFQSDLEKSIRHYYTFPSPDPKFIGYSPSELEQERIERLDSLDMISAFNVLAALEASFRVDFLMRCQKRKKDDLSRYFRTLQKQGANIRLEDGILEGWKIHRPKTKELVSQVIGAFAYRHWLAHGRYWIPKLGRKYDYFSVYSLAQSIYQALALENAEF